MSCFGPAAKQVNALGQYRMGWCPDKMVFLNNQSRRLDYIPDGGGAGGSSKGANTPSRDTLFSVNMYEHEGIARTIEKVTELEADGWIDYQTSWVGVQILVFNPDLAIFVHITMSIYMTPGGAMLPKVDAQSFQPEPYQYPWIIAFDVLFVLCVFFLSFSVVKEIFVYARAERCKEFLKHPWNFLDVLVVLSSYAIIGLYLWLLDDLTKIKDTVMATRAAEPPPGQTSATY